MHAQTSATTHCTARPPNPHPRSTQAACKVSRVPLGAEKTTAARCGHIALRTLRLTMKGRMTDRREFRRKLPIFRGAANCRNVPLNEPATAGERCAQVVLGERESCN